MNRAGFTTGVLSLVLLCGPAQGEGKPSEQWLLWPGPYDAELVDQEQQTAEVRPYFWVRPNQPVGQTFVPARTPLSRIEVILGNNRDPRPGTVRIWKWAGSYEATVAQPPLFSDVLELTSLSRRHAIHPQLDVQPGATYLIELRADGRGDVRLLGSNGPDRYPAGNAYRGGRIPRGWEARDLWFRTYTPSEAAARPERVEASDRSGLWTPPTAPPPISRDSYYEAVAAVAREKTAAVLRACKYRTRLVVLEAFLYKLSCDRGACDESHARNVLEMLRREHAYLLCTPEAEKDEVCKPGCDPDPGERLRFRWPEQPVQAWEWIRHSPSAGPADRARIRELLLEGARRVWLSPELDLNNRSLTAAASYYRLADLYPDAPHAAEWRSHADAVFDRFVSYWDTEEDASDYATAIGWPGLLQLGEASGRDDELWEDPRFRELVRRFAEIIAPAGAPALYGDSSGWRSNNAGSIWLFEKAAARWKDPEYKWLAHQLMRYQRSHAREPSTQHDFTQPGTHYLTYAYLAADDSIQPRRPESQHEELDVRQDASRQGAWSVSAGSAVGQTFVGAGSPLVRIDLRLRDLGDPTPATVSLWEWKGDPRATTAAAPLYRETVGLQGREGFHTYSLYPFLAVASGRTYFLGVERNARLEVAGSAEGENAYPEGGLFVGDRSVAGDLWFRTYTLNGYGSLVTSRLAARQKLRPEWGSPPQKWVLEERRVPDKLLLRSGPGAGDLFAAFNLLADYDHGQKEIGALGTLMDRGSLLMLDTPHPYFFYNTNRQDESAPLLRRYRGGRYTAPSHEAEVTHFRDARNTTEAWVEWNDVSGWDVRQERRFYLVKNRFLLVRDRFTFGDPMLAAAGPVWHAADLQPGSSKNRFVVYDREPLGSTQKSRNPERYALLWFSERPDYEVSALREAYYLPPASCSQKEGPRVRQECRSSPPYVVYQRWTGDAKPGESRWFDTLIVPHGPGAGPREEEVSVEPLRVDSERVGLAIRYGDERWLILDNPEGGAVEVGELSTDARYAIVGLRVDAPPYVRAHRATRLKLENGSFDRDWGVRTSVELGGFQPSRGGGR